MFGLKYRDLMPEWARLEFDQLIAGIKSYLLEPSGEHKEDGSHGAIHADSIDLLGGIAAGAEGQFTGAIHVDRLGVNPSGLGRGDLLSGVFGQTSRVLRMGNYYLRAILGAATTPFDSSTNELQVWDLTHSVSRPLYRVGIITNDGIPNPVIIGGDPGNPRLQIGDFDDQVKRVFSNLGYWERSRTVPLGEWESYVPSFANLTVGNGTLTGRLTKIGKTVEFEIHLTFGGTSSVTGTVTVTVPSSMSNLGTAHAPARCLFFDTSAGQVFAGHSNNQSGTIIALYNNASPLVNMNTTVPFTWATGDQLFVKGSYPEA